MTALANPEQYAWDGTLTLRQKVIIGIAMIGVTLFSIIFLAGRSWG